MPHQKKCNKKYLNIINSARLCFSSINFPFYSHEACCVVQFIILKTKLNTKERFLGALKLSSLSLKLLQNTVKESLDTTLHYKRVYFLFVKISTFCFSFHRDT